MSKKLSAKELEDYEQRLRGLLAVVTGDIDKLEQDEDVQKVYHTLA